MQRLVTIATLVGLLGVPTVASPDKRVPEPQLSDLSRVWVGSTSGGAIGEFLRLELDSEGVGLLVVHWLPSREAQAYRVTATHLKGYAVSFDLQAADTGAETIYLRGQATAYRLELEVGGKNLNWKRPVALDRYTDLIGRLETVNQRAERFWQVGQK
jgi:hypothetical protein